MCALRRQNKFQTVKAKNAQKGCDNDPDFVKLRVERGDCMVILLEIETPIFFLK